jgi:hypothetical protein
MPYGRQSYEGIGYTPQHPLQLSQQQAGYAPEAYQLASQMLAPGAPGGSYGPSNSFMFTGPASAVNSWGGMQHPGMSDPEFQQGLRGIQRSGAGRRAEMAHQMGGASGVDPSSYYRASQAMNQGEQEAVGGLYAQRAQLDRDSMLRATNALSPYMKESAGIAQDYSGNLAALAGNILNSGQYTISGRPPQPHTRIRTRP